MNHYSPGDVLRIAKRQHNSKRTYLLVNPLQAKHIPVSPGKSLEMMGALGAKLAQAYQDCKLVIGFAETATAIGAAVASCFPDDCVYIHTTREDIPEVTGWIHFLEEHSHATDQKLCADSLADRIENTEKLILVDDEISTGKTLINMVEQLRSRFPAVREKQMIAASVINRLTEENEARLSQAGITAECLVKLACDDYAEFVRPIQISPAVDLTGLDMPDMDFFDVIQGQMLPDPREGTEIGRYRASCFRMAETVVPLLQNSVRPGSRLLVLGTEEYMYPALILGQQLERSLGAAVYCHATTRSPIGIAQERDYPVRTGYKLHSFYAGDRESYIYNLAQYDAVIAVTDSRLDCEAPLCELGKALKDHGCGKLFFVHNKMRTVGHARGPDLKSIKSTSARSRAAHTNLYGGDHDEV